MSGDAKISNNRIQLLQNGDTYCIAGGVLVSNGGSFTMSGNAKIVENTVTVAGEKAQGAGGVYVGGNSYSTKDNFIVSGAVQITGNHKTDSTTADNVYLQTDDKGNQAYIKVSGALSDTASIGVSTGTIDEGNYKIVAQGSNYMLTNADLKHFNTFNGE